MATHIPVLADLSVDLLIWDPSGIVCDGTLDGGTLARAICERLTGSGRLWGFDWDEEMVRVAGGTLSDFGDRARLFHAPFSRIGAELEKEGTLCHSIIADLGLSTTVLDDTGRGFRHNDPEAPLDMRMDRSRPRTAADFLAGAGEEEMARTFRELGGVRNARAAARAIVRARESQPIRTSGDLLRALRRGGALRGGPAELSRLYQSLRYCVNDEIGELQHLISGAPDWIVPRGRLVLITYESITDRLAKSCGRMCGVNGNPVWIALTRRVVRPEREEIVRNPRARSAKLRAFERTEEPWQA